MEQSVGWTQRNENLDSYLFYLDSLHLLEEGNIKPVKSLLAPMINFVYGNTVTSSFNHIILSLILS